MNVSARQERELIRDVLTALDTPPDNAEIQGSWLLEGDLRGHPSHGVQRLLTIAARIENGVADPRAQPRLRWVSASSLVVDGAGGLGPCVGLATVDALCERALEHGVAVGGVSNANHLGLLAPYVERCAERSLVGVALTTSEALVHPWGGRRAMVGTNPIAVAVPASPRPFSFDMATGAVSMGKILDHRNRGQALEPGWAVDAEGRPTLDAEAAASGAIAPFGGPKGYGLGLAVELIVATLTSSALGTAVTGTLDPTSACNKGDVFLCLDPRMFGCGDVAERVTEYLDELRAEPAQDGFDGVLVPGDRARATREQRLSEGIPVADSVWEQLEALRARLFAGRAA
jgi:LDH2 family malate/lactate/ureidoglycolate dehydrogenase